MRRWTVHPWEIRGAGARGPGGRCGLGGHLTQADQTYVNWTVWGTETHDATTGGLDPAPASSHP